MREPNETDSIATASVNGWLRKTSLHFKVVEKWPAGESFYLFFEAPMSIAAQELFNRLSMWGGPSKRHPDREDWEAWEFKNDVTPVLQAIIDRTRHYRPEDTLCL